MVVPHRTRFGGVRSLYFALIAVLWLGQTAWAENFSEYRPGKNNRRLIQEVVSQLEEKYGVKVEVNYAKSAHADIGRIYLSESLFDSLAEDSSSVKELEGAIRYVIAHEYFHVALGHPEAANGPWRLSSKDRIFFEKQADYMAAREVLGRELPPSAIIRHLKSLGDQEDYPTADERIMVILSAVQKKFRHDLFGESTQECEEILSHLTAIP